MTKTTAQAVISAFTGNLSKTQVRLVAGGVALLAAAGLLAPLTSSANMSASLVSSVPSSVTQQFPVNGSLDKATLSAAASTPKKDLPKQKPKYTVVRDLGYVVATAFTSRVQETDGNPFVTASGSRVKWGTLACSYQLPFGTKIKIEGFGDKIFVCEDRGSAAFYFDIWYADLQAAYNWGRRSVHAWVVK